MRSLFGALHFVSAVTWPENVSINSLTEESLQHTV